MTTLRKPTFPELRAGAAALACVLVLSALTGCEKEPQAKAAAPPPAPVMVAKAFRRDVPVTVEAIATAKAFNIINVKPQLSGMVTEKLFLAGQWVDEGFVLYRMDDRPYKADLAVAEAELARDEALAAHAKSEADRKADLLARTAASPWEVDQAVTTAKAAAAQVEADKARIVQIKLNIDYCRITSPIDGLLGPTLTDAGNVVKENETMMITIRKLSPIYVEMTVPQQYLGAVRRAMTRAEAEKAKVGMKATDPSTDPSKLGVPMEVRIVDEAEEKPVIGELLFVNNTVDEDTGTLTLRGIFANTDRKLYPGQFLRGKVVLDVKKDAVLVPTNALQNSQDGPFVFVLQPDNTVQMQTVEPGDIIPGLGLIIEKGLTGDETVVTQGQLRLVPGAKVAIRKQAAEAGADGSASVRDKGLMDAQ